MDRESWINIEFIEIKKLPLERTVFVFTWTHTGFASTLNVEPSIALNSKLKGDINLNKTLVIYVYVFIHL